MKDKAAGGRDGIKPGGIGFVSTAGKSAESRENGQHQRDCVCADAGISLRSIVSKEALRAVHIFEPLSAVVQLKKIT